MSTLKFLAPILFLCSVFCSFTLASPGKSYAYRPPSCSELHDMDGNILDYLCPKTGTIRLWVPLSKIDSGLQSLVVLLEDAKFYHHDGIDAEGIMDAIETDIKLGRFAKGGSTITQQLVKNLFLSQEKTLMRKISEVPLAFKLEKELTKKEILELYLNTIEWGPGVYGAEAASRLYFDHGAQTLTENEAWLLALMIPNPKELNLWIRPKAFLSIKKRARTLMNRLIRDKKQSSDMAKQNYVDFLNFVERWKNKMPKHPWESGRTYPALWDETPGLSYVKDLAKLLKVLPQGVTPYKTTIEKSKLVKHWLEKKPKYEKNKFFRFIEIHKNLENHKIISAVVTHSSKTELNDFTSEILTAAQLSKRLK